MFLFFCLLNFASEKCITIQLLRLIRLRPATSNTPRNISRGILDSYSRTTLVPQNLDRAFQDENKIKALIKKLKNKKEFLSENCYAKAIYLPLHIQLEIVATHFGLDYNVVVISVSFILC